MKRFMLSSLLLFSILSTNTGTAQITNSGFEDTLTGGLEGWITTIGSDHSSLHAHTGTNSLSLWNWYYYAPGNAVNGNGSGSVSAWSLDHGMPFNQVPNAMNGFYMYDTSNTYSSNDTALVKVACKRWNTTTNSREVVAEGIGYLLPTDMNNGFVPFTVTVNTIMPGVVPDSILIYFQSSIQGNCILTGNGNCLYLYIDDLSLNLPTGTVDATTFSPVPKIYPNPGSGVISVSDIPEGAQNLSVYGPDGKLIYDHSVSGPVYNLNTTLWAKGTYILRIYDNNGVSANHRFVVN